MDLYGVLTESGPDFQPLFAVHLGCVSDTKSDTFSGKQGGIWIRALPADTFGDFWALLATLGDICPSMGFSLFWS